MTKLRRQLVLLGLARNPSLGNHLLCLRHVPRGRPYQTCSRVAQETEVVEFQLTRQAETHGDMLPEDESLEADVRLPSTGPLAVSHNCLQPQPELEETGPQAEDTEQPTPSIAPSPLPSPSPREIEIDAEAGEDMRELAVVPEVKLEHESVPVLKPDLEPEVHEPTGAEQGEAVKAEEEEVEMKEAEPEAESEAEPEQEPETEPVPVVDEDVEAIVVDSPEVSAEPFSQSSPAPRETGAVPPSESTSPSKDDIDPEEPSVSAGGEGDGMEVRTGVDRTSLHIQRWMLSHVYSRGRHLARQLRRSSRPKRDKPGYSSRRRAGDRTTCPCAGAQIYS
jgi:hypothetical protein